MLTALREWSQKRRLRAMLNDPRSKRGFRSMVQLEKGIGADRSTTERLLLSIGARKATARKSGRSIRSERGFHRPQLIVQAHQIVSGGARGEASVALCARTRASSPPGAGPHIQLRDHDKKNIGKPGTGVFAGDLSTFKLVNHVVRAGLNYKFW